MNNEQLEEYVDKYLSDEKLEKLRYLFAEIIRLDDTISRAIPGFYVVYTLLSILDDERKESGWEHK